MGLGLRNGEEKENTPKKKKKKNTPEIGTEHLYDRGEGICSF